ncbi:MAG TPA: metallophosphoesterase [Opitutaceae bacterium]|jgi:Icc protein|nr:metallophosphoesterase [Opitutaceae bacterium]
MNDLILHNDHNDGIDRRGFLKCMAWTGTGVLWSVSGGLLTSRVLGQTTGGAALPAPVGELHFVQISDSHIGFSKPAINQDVTATFRETIARINALPNAPEFLLHTGDLSHLAEADEFDTLEQLLKDCKTKQVFYVPGEHDILSDNGAQYMARFGKGSLGTGWHSFDHKGVHFIGLSNVANIAEGGLGTIGAEQLDWLAKDLAPLSADTPIVVYAHIPLWSIYPKWGWGTDDAEKALTMLKRFGSVTVLNGHIHQALQKIEGNITFHTARSTAFPQPAPGAAPKPGPMKVEAARLRSFLGLTNVSYVETATPLAIVDSTLADQG